MSKKIESYLYIIILILAITSSVIIFSKNKNEYLSKQYTKNSILEDIKTEKLEIIDLKKQEINLKNAIEEAVLKTDIIKNDLDENYVLNSSTFKKIIFNLSDKAELKLVDMTNIQKIKSFDEYCLNNITLSLNGSLNSFGKFLYFVDKVNYFIDTDKLNFSLTGDRFIVNLGFIEKEEINA